LGGEQKLTVEASYEASRPEKGMAAVSMLFIQSSDMRPKRATASPSPAVSRKVELIIMVGRDLTVICKY
jgi:hypothetical protein